MPLLLPLLAPLLLLAAASLAAHAAPIPALPSWAKGPNYRGDDAWKPYSVEQGLRNRQNMLEANQDSRPFDFILYGDSITQLVYRNGKREWDAQFPAAAGWKAAPLGVSGNDIQDLAWRVIGGWERPRLAPACVALLIGTNNVSGEMPPAELAQKVNYLIQYFRKAYPSTKIVLMALLKTTKYSVAQANQWYSWLGMQPGVLFLDCSRSVDPFDKTQLYDGTHPTPKGIDLLLKCMAPTVRALVGKGRSGQPLVG